MPQPMPGVDRQTDRQTDRQAEGQGKTGETTVRTSDKQRGDLSVVGAATAVTLFTAGCGVVSVLGCDET